MDEDAGLSSFSSKAGLAAEVFGSDGGVGKVYGCSNVAIPDSGNVISERISLSIGFSEAFEAN